MNERRYKSMKFNFNGGCDTPAAYHIKGMVAMEDRGSSPVTKNQTSRLTFDLNLKESSIGRIDELHEALTKLFDKNDKLFLLPDLFRYLNQENQIKTRINRSNTTLSITIEPGYKLQGYIQELFATIGVPDLKRLLGDKSYEFMFQLGFTHDFDDIRKAYCDDPFNKPVSSHVLEDSELLCYISEDDEVNATLDEGLMFRFSNYTFPYLSFMDSGEIEINIDFKNQDDQLSMWTKDNMANDIFESIQQYIDKSIGYFQSLETADLDNLVAFASLISEVELAEPPRLLLEFDEFLHVEIKFELVGLADFVQFLAHHPFAKDTQKIQKYKDFFRTKYYYE